MYAPQHQSAPVATGFAAGDLRTQQVHVLYFAAFAHRLDRTWQFLSAEERRRLDARLDQALEEGLPELALTPCGVSNVQRRGADAAELFAASHAPSSLRAERMIQLLGGLIA